MQRKKFILTALSALGALTAFASRENSSTAGPPKKFYKLSGGKGRYKDSLFRGRNPNNIKVSKNDTDGQLSMFEYIGVEKIGPPLHVHFKQDETFYVVEGEYRFVVGDVTETLKAGDTIFLPRNVPHTWLQLSETGKMIYLLHPARKFEDFMNTLDALPGPPTEAQFNQITLDHEMKNVGPPLQL